MKRIISVLIVFFSVSIASAQQKTLAPQQDTTVYTTTDQEATFPGGIENFYKYVGQNIHYPAEARMQLLQGRVSVYTVIEKDGSLSNVKAIRGISPDLNKEAVRVVSESPKWVPAMLNGHEVRSSFTIPITFRLGITNVTGTNANPASTSSSGFRPIGTQPSFPGGVDKLMSFIYKYLRYPKEDEKNDVRGKVIISFVIEKDGSMTDFEVVKSLSMTADGEALRVVKMITQKWEPGTQNGQPVRVKFTVPIMFPPLQPW